MHIFSERLSELMKGRFTQQDIAARVGVSQPTIQRWLTGTMPGGAEMYRLAKSLGVSVESLMEGTISYGEHQPQAMKMHDAPPNKAVAKLKTQVQSLKRQIETIETTLEEL